MTKVNLNETRGFLGSIAIILKNRKFKIGFIMLLIIILIAVFEPLINHIRLEGKNPYEYALFEFWLPPSIEHPLGTDWFGRDTLALMLIGLKNSLIIGFLAGLVSLLIGLPIAFLRVWLKSISRWIRLCSRGIVAFCSRRFLPERPPILSSFPLRRQFLQPFPTKLQIG